MRKVKFGIFTKPIHVEKIVNFLNLKTNYKYIISTDKRELYKCFDFDIGISYGFGDIIDIDKTCTKNWFNFHPAMLPMYKGSGCYAKAIGDEVKFFGVSVHRMTMKIDTGFLIDEILFDLDVIPVSTNEIGCICHYYLFQLFKRFMLNKKYVVEG